MSCVSLDARPEGAPVSGAPFYEVAAQVRRAIERLFERPHVFLFLVGIPGSGKTTFIQQFLRSYDGVSFDRLVEPLLNARSDTETYVQGLNLRIVNEMEAAVRRRIADVAPVIIFEEATLGLSVFRAHFLHMARQAGYWTALVHFPIDIDTAYKRNELRGLSMSREGQMRMPKILLDTIHDHQNTGFKLLDRPMLMADSSPRPFLCTQLSAAEQALVNEAFFKFVTIASPENADLREFLLTQDRVHEIWSVSNTQFFRKCAESKAPHAS